MTESPDVVDPDETGKNRKWRLALHGHLDSIHYARPIETLGIPTLGVDAGGLYVLPEHSATRNTQKQAAKDYIHMAKAFATMLSELKEGNRENVLKRVPIGAARIIEEEFGGIIPGTGLERKGLVRK